jgi:hypothetical protein
LIKDTVCVSFRDLGLRGGTQRDEPCALVTVPRGEAVEASQHRLELPDGGVVRREVGLIAGEQIPSLSRLGVLDDGEQIAGASHDVL